MHTSDSPPPSSVSYAPGCLADKPGSEYYPTFLCAERMYFHGYATSTSLVPQAYTYLTNSAPSVLPWHGFLTTLIYADLFHSTFYTTLPLTVLTNAGFYKTIPFTDLCEQGFYKIPSLTVLSDTGFYTTERITADKTSK